MELRKDYVLDRWVIVGTARGKRPRQFAQPKDVSAMQLDLFAPGNESLTPPETGRIGSPWKMRWFPNKFPFVEPAGKQDVRGRKFFSSAAAYGYHEIIVETPTKKQLWDLREQDLVTLLDVYEARIRELEKRKGIAYVQVFKNNGRKGGTSIAHSHTQAAAVAVIPPVVREEMAAMRSFGRECYRKIIAAERRGKRRCFETRHVLAFAPFASRYNFELWVFPKRYVRRLEELSVAEKKDMAAVLKKALARLKGINAPYNMFLHYAPRGRELHLHMEITPRMQNWAGFEISSGIIVNEVLPEEAAKFYRAK